MKGGASLELEQLVKDYQGGDTSTLEAIQAHIWPREGRTVIRLICGQGRPGYLPGADNMPVTIKAFTFNQAELEAVFNKKLIKALNTYEATRAAKFGSWFYRLFKQGLQDLKREYLKQQTDGETVRSFEEYQELRKLIFGNPLDPEVLKQETSIPAELLEQLSDNEKSFMALTFNAAKHNKKIIDDVAGQVLGVSRQQVSNYKKNIRDVLQGYSIQGGRADELPALKNEFGITDPTPREAAFNIKNSL
jgi:cation transport regulator ChaB